MKQIYDENSANEVYQENRHYLIQFNAEKNRILRMTNPIKKQEAWRKLHGMDVALNGLSEEELSLPF